MSSRFREILEMYWSDNPKSRIVNNESTNCYKSNNKSKKLIRSQIDIYNYYKSKLEE